MGATNEIIDFRLRVASTGEELRMKIAGDQIFLDGKCLEGVEVTHKMRTLADEFRDNVAQCGKNSVEAADLQERFALDLYRMMPPGSEGRTMFGPIGLLRVI